MNKIKTYDRKLLYKYMCKYCGSFSDVYLDYQHDEDICLECVNKERIEDFENKNNSED